jgi:hypothetical protein
MSETSVGTEAEVEVLAAGVAVAVAEAWAPAFWRSKTPLATSTVATMATESAPITR